MKRDEVISTVLSTLAATALMAVLLFSVTCGFIYVADQGKPEPTQTPIHSTDSNYEAVVLVEDATSHIELVGCPGGGVDRGAGGHNYYPLKYDSEPAAVSASDEVASASDYQECELCGAYMSSDLVYRPRQRRVHSLTTRKWAGGEIVLCDSCTLEILWEDLEHDETIRRILKEKETER